MMNVTRIAQTKPWIVIFSACSMLGCTTSESPVEPCEPAESSSASGGGDAGVSADDLGIPLYVGECPSRTVVVIGTLDGAEIRHTFAESRVQLDPLDVGEPDEQPPYLIFRMGSRDGNTGDVVLKWPDVAHPGDLVPIESGFVRFFSVHMRDILPGSKVIFDTGFNGSLKFNLNFEGGNVVGCAK